MAQFYKCFIRNFASIMARINKLFKKIEIFEWTAKCQTTQEDIKNWYIQAPILISPNGELEFHVHTNASQLVVGAILVQNPIGKIDQLVMYSSRLFNSAERNYITTKREALAMVYALHKFKHYLLGNKFTFYIKHMALVYLVNKPQVFGKLVKQLVLFLEYNFKIGYKLDRFHIMANALNRLPNWSKLVGVPNQTCVHNLLTL